MNMDHESYIELLDNLAWESPDTFLEDPAHRQGSGDGYTAHLAEKHCAWTIGELFARQIAENKTDVSVFASKDDMLDAITNFIAYYKEQIAVWVEKRPIEFNSPELYKRLIFEFDLGANDEDETLGYGVSSDGSIWYSSGIRMVLKRDNDPRNELGFYIEDAYPLRKYAIFDKNECISPESIRNYELKPEDKMKLTIDALRNESDAFKLYPKMTSKKVIHGGQPMIFLNVPVNEDQKLTLDCKEHGCEIKMFTYNEEGRSVKKQLTMDKIMDMSPELYDLFVKIDSYRHEIYNDRTALRNPVHEDEER